MSFPRYPKYKDSGFEWMGEVPAHWEVKRSDSIVSADRTQISPEAFVDREVFHYSIPVVQETGTGQVESGQSIASAKQVVRRPVVLVSKLNPRKATICLAKPQSILTLCSTEFVSLSADKCELAFLEYLARSELFRQGLESKVQSVTRSHQRADPADIYRFWNAWPTLEDQRAIAAFLDRETGKIDELVAEQRRLMDLLKEKRQAVISHAVTKGLNPRAPMKDSGIEWLGEVPGHWGVKRVKTVSQFTTSGPRGWSERVGEEGSLFIQSGDLDDSLNVEFESAKRVLVQEDAESTRTRLSSGDVVVCITGAKTGNVAVCTTLPEPAYVNQHLCLIRPSTEILPGFLGILLKSQLGQRYFEISQYGLKQGLSLENVREAPVLLPPRREQAEILSFVGAETAKLDTFTAEAQRAIDLLQERRTALISAAVTGQIDVRKVAG